MRSTLLTIISALALCAGGCATGPGASDTSISTSVKMRLLTNLNTSALYIHPQTNGGVVTLTGGVVSRWEREEAVRLARGVAGVRDVRDEMANRQNF